MADLTTNSNDAATDDAEVFRRCYTKLRRFAAVVAPPEVEPEDLLQDALVATMRTRPLRELEYPEAYLRRVILNQVSNHQRRSRVRWNAERLLRASRTQPLEVYPSDLSELMWLSPRQRAVLYLSEVEGFTFDEIAEMVGCSAPAARMSATRARRRLKVAMESEGAA